MRAFLKRNYFHWLNFLPAGFVLALGVIYGSYFDIICSACLMLIMLVQNRLHDDFGAKENWQQTRCKPIGYLLLLPAMALIGCGIAAYFIPHVPLQMIPILCIVGLSGVVVVLLLLQMISIWNQDCLSARFLKHTTLAALCASLPTIIVSLLRFAAPEEVAALSCLTTVVFGCFVLSIALTMILVSCCGYRSTAESFGMIRTLIQSKKLIFTRMTLLKDGLLVAGKAIISLVSLSFFMFANALYSAGMGIARFVAIKMHSQPREQQIESYRRVGIIIVIASVCYVLYSVRLFFGGKTGAYSMIISLAIACYTFVEFGINIREAFRLRGSHALEAKAMRAISFSSTLLCFVLTQTAIMSFADASDNAAANALAGVIFGGLASLVGVYVLIDSRTIRKSY